MYYCGMSGKELGRCMAFSPVTPFLSSSSQYVYQFNKLTKILAIVLTYTGKTRYLYVSKRFIVLKLMAVNERINTEFIFRR